MESALEPLFVMMAMIFGWPRDFFMTRDSGERERNREEEEEAKHFGEK